MTTLRTVWRDRRPGVLIGAGLLLLALVASSLTIGWPLGLGLEVPINHGTLPGLTGSFGDAGDTIGCYTSGTTGDLVNDSDAGIVIVESSGHRSPVVFPPGWTGRRAGFEVAILDRAGQFVVQTGTRVSLLGGYLPDNNFLACQGSHPLP
jgi:hypothetical protein